MKHNVKDMNSTAASETEEGKKLSVFYNLLGKNSKDGMESVSSQKLFVRKPSLASFVRNTYQSSLNTSVNPGNSPSEERNGNPQKENQDIKGHGHEHIEGTEKNVTTTRYSMASVDSKASFISGASRNNSVSSSTNRFTNDNYDALIERDSMLSASNIELNYKGRSPTWFIVQISNRNTSLKMLYKSLALLRNALINNGPHFIHDFIASTVPHLGTNGISGISSLEIALDRVCAPYLQKRARSRPASMRSGVSGIAHSKYGDHILPDEIRLKVLKCVDILMQTDYGMSVILISNGLLRQIIWCYSAPPSEDMMEWDKKSTATYLKLISLISRILGPACFIDGGLKDTVVSVMCELQRHQNEPYPFYHFIQSLRSPGISNPGTTNIDGFRRSVFGTSSYSRRSASSFIAAQKNIIKQDDPYNIPEYQWVYRTQAMVLINGIISSGTTIARRSKLRKVLEKSSFRAILHNLIAQTDAVPREFIKQVELYMQDRQLDVRESEREFREKNEKDKSRFIQNMEALFNTIQSMPDPEMINHYVKSTLQNIEAIVRGIEPQSFETSGYLNMINVNIVNEMKNQDAAFTRREDIGLLLSLIERTTRSLAGSIRPVENIESTSEAADQKDAEKVDEPIAKGEISPLKLENIQADFFEAAREVLGDENLDLEMDQVLSSPLEKQSKHTNVGALAEELEYVKQQYRVALEEHQAFQKENDFLKISLWSKDASAHDQDQPVTFYSGEDLQAFQDYQKLKGNAEESGETDAISRADAQPIPFHSVKQMWGDIQRLQGLVNILEEEKKERIEKEVRENATTQAGKTEVVEKEQKAEENIEEENILAEISAPPLPPPNGPPGPPPPAPALLGKANSEMIHISNVPMKPFQWEKLATHNTKSTIWSKIFDRAYREPPKEVLTQLCPTLDSQKFIAMFSKNLNEVKQNPYTLVTEPEKVVVRFLDTKQKIMMNSFKLKSSAVREGILTINDKLMNSDRIARLLSNIPSLDLMETIASYDGPSADLGVSEQFLLELSVISRLGKRLECMAFRHQFFQEYSEIEPDITTLMEAIHQIKESSHFSLILELVLIIGNFLNGTSFRGGAHGFKISSLLSMSDTKANYVDGMIRPVINGKKLEMTLLHSVVRILEEFYPDALHFLEKEMPDVAEAAKIPILSLFEVVNDLQTGLHNAQIELEQARNSKLLNEKDMFIQVFSEFCQDTLVKMRVITTRIAGVKESLDSLFSIFSEEELEKQDEPQLFFVTFSKFSAMLKKAKRENNLQDQQIRKVKARSFQQIDAVKWFENNQESSQGYQCTKEIFIPLEDLNEIEPFSKLSLPPGITVAFDEKYKDSRAFQISNTLLRGNKSLAESRRIISMYSSTAVEK